MWDKLAEPSRPDAKKHMRHIRLRQPEKSLVAAHRFETGHNINFSCISILDKATGYMDRIIKDAIKIMQPTNPTKIANKGRSFAQAPDIVPC
jgi:hypothetical protein